MISNLENVYFVGTLVIHGAAKLDSDNDGWHVIKNSNPSPCDSTSPGHIRQCNYQCRLLDNAVDGDCKEIICICFGTSDHGCGHQAPWLAVSSEHYQRTCSDDDDDDAGNDDDDVRDQDYDVQDNDDNDDDDDIDDYFDHDDAIYCDDYCINNSLGIIGNCIEGLCSCCGSPSNYAVVPSTE